MVGIRHCGIYVHNIDELTKFYKNVFNMSPIVEKLCDSGKCIDALIGVPGARIWITKLITEKGKMIGDGDMIELVQIDYPRERVSDSIRRISDTGSVHIAFECNIQETIRRIEENSGRVIVSPMIRDNGNILCFCEDPEGNFLELIERK